MSRFILCPNCLKEYGALRLDPNARYSLNIMPLGSLIWPDEHPAGISPPPGRPPLPPMSHLDHRNHPQCFGSLMQLASARTGLWLTGSVPEASRELWDGARRILPEWPGFSRLTLDASQKAALDGCKDEVDELFGTIASRFPSVTVTEAQGGARIRATREPPATARQARWWQFWK
jgi:hypothetical protein